MGLFQLLGVVVLIVVVTGAAIWVIDYLIPKHPDIIDRGLWVVACALIGLAIWTALGGHDYRIPKVF